MILAEPTHPPYLATEVPAGGSEAVEGDPQARNQRRVQGLATCRLPGGSPILREGGDRLSSARKVIASSRRGVAWARRASWLMG